MQLEILLKLIWRKLLTFVILAPCELSGIVINEQEVYDQFQILNISKPAGPDNLPPKFLKAVFQSLVKPRSFKF
jgi:hypothetical protein